MKTMEANEPTIYPSSRISQMNIGELEIETMAYTSGEEVKFCHQISIRAVTLEDEKGWGHLIFKGTLKELMARLNREEVK